MTLLPFLQRSSLTAMILFLLGFQGFAQSEIKPVAQKVRQLRESGANFTSFSPFSSAFRPNARALEAVKSAQFLRFNPELIQEILDKHPKQISLQLPYNGTTIQLDLYQENVLGSNFAVLSRLDEVQFYNPGVYYRGVLHDDYHSVASFSFFEDEVIGFASNETLGNLVLGRLEGSEDLKDYILYSDRDLREQNAFSCSERESGNKPFPTDPFAAPEFVNLNGCVEIFFECDYALFQNKGSVSATVNFMTGVFAQVATLYNNEQLSIKISRVYVWTTPDSYSTASSSTALDQFMALRTSYDGDLAHLVSLSGTNLGGIAYLDVLCSSSLGYGYSGIDNYYNNVPTYSWTINVLAHELGHNFSSHHTHWCGWPGGPIDNCYPVDDGPCTAGPAPTNGGTIMSYCHLTSNGVNFNNGFGPLPRATMQSAVTTAFNSGCVPATCPSSTCASPTSITASSITQTSASISWTTVSGGTAYNLHYRPVGSSSWLSINNASNPQTLSNLNVNALYEVELQSICGGSSSEFTNGIIFKTNNSACNAPTAVTASSPGNNNINIAWTDVNSPAPSSYDLQYAPRGFSLGSGAIATVSTASATLGSLITGTSYQCYVRSNCSGGNGTSAWSSAVDFQTALGNNAIANAVELTVGAPCLGTNVFRNTAATTESGEFSPTTGNGGYWATSAGNTVWFKFTAPPSGTVKINTNISPGGTLSDTQVALYNSSSTSATSFLASNEDGLDANSNYRALMVYSGLTAGSVYYIQVDGYSTQTGEFCLEVTEDFSIPTPNTTCTNYPISGTNAVNGTINSNSGKWINLYAKPDGFNIGRPIAAIKTNQNLGNVTVNAIRTVSVPTGYNGVKYIQRYFNFNCTQNTTGNKDVRLFFTDAELNSLKSASGQTGSSAADINISHYDGANENCTPDDNGGNSTLITSVTDNSIGSSGLFYLEFTSPGFSEMGAHFGAAPLPVELLNFEVSVVGRSNLLVWKATVESNFERYEIERSANGHSDWVKIGERLPLGGNYQYEDASPFKDSYYRLKMLDKSDNFKYSNILHARREQGSDGLNRVYPNPVQDLLWVEYAVSEESDLTVQVWHNDGRLLFDLTQTVVKGSNLIPLDVAALPTGIYFLSLKTESAPLEHLSFVKR